MRVLGFIFFCLLCLLLSSCRQYRYIYAASKINTPALQKKGDTRLNTSFSFGNARGFGDSSSNNGLDVQGAFALSNHFAVIGSYYSRTEADQLDFGNYRGIDFTDSYVRYRRHLIEGGIGYLAQVNSKASFSVYGGVAFGKMAINDAGLIDSVAYTRFFNTNMHKYFLQPGITFFNRTKGSFDLSLRLTLLQSLTSGTNYNQRELTYFNLRPTGETQTALFMEPSFNFQFALFNTDWLKAETGLAFVNRSSSANARGWNLSLGLTLDPVKAFKQ